MDDRNRSSPVALSGDEPVTNFIFILVFIDDPVSLHVFDSLWPFR